MIQDLLNENKIRKKDYTKIAVSLHDIDDIINSKPEDLSSRNFKFFDAATKHVTDASARRIRHEFIKNHIVANIST